MRDLLEVGPEIHCPVCHGLADPQGCGPDAVHLFPCCPRSLFHLSCLARLTPVDGRVWCPTCPEDVRSGVDADWFERQCHINGVDFPADPGCGVCTVCVEEMTVNSSIEVPCCHQRLHVTCLARSFSSRGVDPQGCGPDAVHLFPCCPRSLFHLSCLARLTPVDGRVWCPTCPEDVRSGVDADWFERQCHINGVDFPADPGCGVCTVCVEEMTVNSSIEVPCCHQRLHVTCLARSFSSRGVDCPFCNQSIAEFARSSSFLASSLFHGCLVDLDVPPSNRGTNSLVLPLGFPRPPDDLTLLCCPRSGPPPDFEESADRRMEWSPQQLSNHWDPQWLCLRCGRSMELSQIPQRPDIVCSQCGVHCPTMIMDCRERSRWMWCPHCQRREEISHVQPVPPTWFSHGPLTTLGRLYAWGDSPILPPGAGSQSWLFCPLISLGLVHAERARSVALYSTGSRTPLPAPQHDFWMSCASDIVQLYGEYFQSLSPSSAVATMLQSGWSGGEHLPALVQEQCTPSHIMDALHAWLSIQCSAFGGDQHSQPQSLNPVAVPLPEVPAQPSPFSGALSGVPDRVDQRPQSHSTNGVVVHSLPAVPPQPSPFSCSASSVPGSNLIAPVPQSVSAVPVAPTSIPQSSSGVVPDAPPRDAPCSSPFTSTAPAISPLGIAPPSVSSPFVDLRGPPSVGVRAPTGSHPEAGPVRLTRFVDMSLENYYATVNGMVLLDPPAGFFFFAGPSRPYRNCLQVDEIRFTMWWIHLSSLHSTVGSRANPLCPIACCPSSAQWGDVRAQCNIQMPPCQVIRHRVLPTVTIENGDPPAYWCVPHESAPPHSPPRGGLESSGPRWHPSCHVECRPPQRHPLQFLC